MERLISKVTRKGQITIPAELRKRHKIIQGAYVKLSDDEKGIRIEPIPDLLDLLGIDKGKYDVDALKEELDKSRKRWR